MRRRLWLYAAGVTLGAILLTLGGICATREARKEAQREHLETLDHLETLTTGAETLAAALNGLKAANLDSRLEINGAIEKNTSLLSALINRSNTSTLQELSSVLAAVKGQPVYECVDLAMITLTGYLGDPGSGMTPVKLDVFMGGKICGQGIQLYPGERVTPREGPTPALPSTTRN